MKPLIRDVTAVCAVGVSSLAIIGAVVDADVGAAATQKRVVLVTDIGGCEGAATLGLCEGFTRAVRITGVSGKIVQPTQREDIVDTIVLLTRQNYDLVLVFGVGYVNNSAFGEVVRRRPESRFAIMDGPRSIVPGHPRNVGGILFRASEASYLAGWLAGKLERQRAGRDVVGVVGGIKFPSVDEFIVGFRAGARRAAPGIRVLTAYSYNFLDAARCRAIARNQIAKGAGVVFNVAGACGLGTLQAAADAGVLGIGVDTDQSHLGPHVLTSVLKRFDAGFLAVLRDLEAGKMVTGRDRVLTMREGAVGLGSISRKVPGGMRAELESLRRRIVAGEIRVPGIVPNPR